MDKKILVDTSAWILSFKRSGQEALDKDQVVTTPFIVLELLQGCKTQKEFDDLEIRLTSLESYPPETRTWEGVYGFGFPLRRKGLTLPTLDILLAFLAIQKDFVLLHHDHHFRKIAEQSKLVAIDFLG